MADYVESIDQVRRLWKDIGSSDVEHALSVHLGNSGAVRQIASSFSRPNDTTQYASGDLVANSTTAGSVTPLTFADAALLSGRGGKSIGARLRKSGTSLTNAMFRLHIFGSAPTGFVAGDNGAFSCAGVANYVGAFDITCDRTFTDGVFGRGATPLSGSFLEYVCAATSLFGVLEARAAYTPAAQEVFTLSLSVLPD